MTFNKPSIPDIHSLVTIKIMSEPWAANPEHNHVRNFRGYGEEGLQGLQWPNNSKIAVSFVINYEEVSIISNSSTVISP